ANRSTLTRSIPAAPRFVSTCCQAPRSVLGRYTLSIRLNHLPPRTPLASAANMRSVQTERSTHAHSSGRVDAACVDLAVTLAASPVLSLIPNLPHPPSCPASLTAGSALRGSRVHPSWIQAGSAPQRSSL